MNYIAALRRGRGISQKQLAERIGVCQQAVAAWEKGEKLPRASRLIALAEILGVSVDELLGGKAEQSEE